MCPGGTQLKTTGGGMLEEVAMKKNSMSGNAAQMDAAAASMHALEEGCYSVAYLYNTRFYAGWQKSAR